ncbi:MULTISPECIES: hypothetical protein [Haloferax]|uniref:DUF6788 domain-containing protein n=2 Tax=Haloferax TaxID=2251 RepID=A0A6G1Z7C9_9EURY|nr:MULTISPECIES: hypothetical protein [Haloferax]KAB1184839.1 hypothetical protein Hfx1149_17345 [Haloferax sp. CBA1149]MRW82460.1 hypothetical protein [Haloferax marinisediminis]
MSHESPTPHPEIPAGIVEQLESLPSDTLNHVSRYAERLAEHRERERRLEVQQESDRVKKERPSDLPEDVPSRATITIKEINDNRYYYWQWREGDKVKSKYKGPMNKSGND